MSLDRTFFQTPRWVMGLMSGTSADGVDGALLQLSDKGIEAWGATRYHPYTPDLHVRILAAMGSEIVDAQLEQDITAAHYKLVRSLIRQSGIVPDLIGFHGQTLYHVPRSLGQKARTLQIGHAHRLAHWLNTPVVSQFRLKDIEAGGEGAPLVPIFHRALLEPLLSTQELTTCAVVNVGGVCNITLFEADGSLLAGDVGPGCALIDDWLKIHPTLTYDNFSDLALRGEADISLINKWIEQSLFFKKSLPKSADRLQWQIFLEDIAHYSQKNAAATLVGLTVEGLRRSLPLRVHTLYLAGGGRKHACLMEVLSRYYRALCVDDIGCSGDFLEAYAFAFLARQSVLDWPISFPGTTGVSQPTSGGILHTN